MIQGIKRTGIVASLVLTGSLVAAPAALAAPSAAASAVPGYGLEHHHDCPCDRPHHDHHDGDHHDGHDGPHHWHGEGPEHDSAHAGGGYDSHRHHPRPWYF